MIARTLLAATFALLMAGAAPAADRLADAKAQVAAVRDNAALIEDLSGMGNVDREVRTRLLAIRKDATPEERAALDQQVGAMIDKLDEEHAARLKAILARRPGWFPISIFGERAAQSASLIVNHSDDVALRRDALARMEPLSGTPELNSQDYATIYDRTALMGGGRQRYGTQGGACANGAHAIPADVEDPARLDARRASLKLEPMRDYLAGLDRLYGRCDR